ncbi:hypothetical protein VP1G_02758 [Cytospora mali]|uniref:Uncharacterized protein n=1 Tax=Cytospora mali TaxID=578113 RepID=A0A194UUY3_CYTMA|nr:hypothetical protein VP1G_02758 [Valsa mali var. pyri (nom. inval.)]
MDPSSSHTTNDIPSNPTGSRNNSPPSLIWIIIPLIVVLVTGFLIAILYQTITRCRRRKTGEDDPERAITGRGTAILEVGDATGGGGPAPSTTTTTTTRPGTRHHTEPRPSQHTDRWGWVFDISSSRSATRTSEGLNELGEAPPPYGEETERPKSYEAQMVEVGDGGGEGPSAGAPRQQGLAGLRQPSTGSEPPAYEMTVGEGEGETELVREPPPAVTPRSR